MTNYAILFHNRTFYGVFPQMTYKVFHTLQNTSVHSPNFPPSLLCKSEETKDEFEGVIGISSRQNIHQRKGR